MGDLVNPFPRYGSIPKSSTKRLMQEQHEKQEKQDNHFVSYRQISTV